eukprot:Selendium_serpulae@DN5353_c0_g1_i4.p1
MGDEIKIENGRKTMSTISLPKNAKVTKTGKSRSGQPKRKRLRSLLTKPAWTGTTTTLVVNVYDRTGSGSGSSEEVLASRIFGGADDQVNPKGILESISLQQLQIVPATGPGITNGVMRVDVDLTAIEEESYDVMTAAKVAAEAVTGFAMSTVGHVKYALPETVDSDVYTAYAGVHTNWSYYDRTIITYPRPSTRTFAMNIGFGTANGVGGAGYQDASGFMGYSFIGDHEEGLQVFNGPNSYFTGWYDESKALIMDSSQITDATWTGKVFGVADIANATEGYFVVIVPAANGEQTDDVFISYNRATGLNRDTVSYPDQVVIHKAFADFTLLVDCNIPTEVLATLDAGQEFYIDNFNGGSDGLKIKCSEVTTDPTTGIQSASVEVAQLPPTLLGWHMCFLGRAILDYHLASSYMYENQLWTCHHSDGVFHFDTALDDARLTSLYKQSGDEVITINALLPAGKSRTVVLPDELEVLDGRRNGRSDLSSLPYNAYMTGTHNVLVIAAYDNTGVGLSTTPETISNRVFGTGGDTVTLKSLMESCSYGKVSLVPAIPHEEGSVVDGVVTVNLDMDFRDYTLIELLWHVESKANYLTYLNMEEVDKVLITVPHAKDDFDVATGELHNWAIFKKSKINQPSFVMHAIGHMWGFGHAFKEEAEVGDTIGFMGRSWGGHNKFLMCYNPVFSYFTGWYSDRHVTLQPSDLPWTGKVFGIADYGKKPIAEGAAIVVVVKQPNKPKGSDYFIGYNRASGINAETHTKKDKVTIHQSWADHEPLRDSNTDSHCMGSLSDTGSTYSVDNFNGEALTLTITLTLVETEGDLVYANIGVATAASSDRRQLREKAQKAKCVGDCKL